jgi:hypothetical protein
MRIPHSPHQRRTLLSIGFFFLLGLPLLSAGQAWSESDSLIRGLRDDGDEFSLFPWSMRRMDFALAPAIDFSRQASQGLREESLQMGARLPSPSGSSSSGNILTASDGAVNDQFAFSVSISGTTAIAGAKADQDNGVGSGSAYIFKDVTGTPVQAKLTPSDGGRFDQFGYSVGISGTTAIVGAVSDADKGRFSGSAYIFKDVTGTPVEVKLTASDGAANDNFGYSVGISGTTAIVGADGGHGNAAGSGAAYVFKDVTGTPVEVKLTASDGAAGDNFGGSVGISGTTAIVGAQTDADNGTNSGSAYIFKDVTGTPVQVKLTASDGGVSNYFGISVGISGTTAIVGAYGGDGKVAGSGAAYVFKDVTGTPVEVKLTASDGALGDDFGKSVGISGTTAIVGAFFADAKGLNSGAAYLFQDVTATPVEVKLMASDGAAGDEFGTAVAIDGDNFVVGADLKNSFTGQAYSGSVSAFTTLDEGNSSRTTGGLSFISQTDWIVGRTTSANQTTLSAGDAGTVTAAGKAVYIGQQAGSNNNTLVVAGSLTVSQIHVGAVGNTGNTLRLAGVGNRINDTAAIHLSNGTFDTAGTSETAGVFSLEGASVIDLGNLSSILRFAVSSGQTWSGTLSIYNWSGSDTGGGPDQLYFGASSAGLTSLQLAQISFYSDNGSNFLGSAQILADGEVVPAMGAVPEPATYFLIALGAAALGWNQLRSGKKLTAQDRP